VGSLTPAPLKFSFATLGDEGASLGVKVGSPVNIPMIMGTPLVAVAHNLDFYTDLDPIMFWCKADVGVEHRAIVIFGANALLWIHSGVSDNFPLLALV